MGWVYVSNVYIRTSYRTTRPPCAFVSILILAPNDAATGLLIPREVGEMGTEMGTEWRFGQQWGME